MSELSCIVSWRTKLGHRMVTLLGQENRNVSHDMALPPSRIDSARLSAAGHGEALRARPIVHSPLSFQKVAQREFALADRLGLTLVAAVFRSRLEPMDSSEGIIRAIGRSLLPTDVLGTTADGEIAVLLPCSDDVRANAFLAGLKREVAAEEFETLRPFVSTYSGERREWLSDTVSNTSQILPDTLRALQSSAVAEEPSIPKWKRCLDIVIALFCLLLLSPLFLVTGLFIKLTSRGPIFFRQERIGYLGRPFRIWKFRTMVCASQAEAHQKYVSQLTQNGSQLKKMDFRAQLIPLGRWMRVLCIDELPQLFNVLAGSMSLVGPRPDVVPLDVYKPWQLRRFLAVPGMTGLWQVCGKNRTTFEEMVHLDIAYSQSMSPALDARILLKTLPAIIQQVWEGSLQ